LPDRKLVTEPVLYGEGAGLTRSGAASADRRRVSGYSYRGVAYIALSGADPTSTTYHEGFHVLEQMGLFSDQETAVMERDRARLLPLAAQALAGKGDPSRLSPRELRTYAFEQYRRDREAERFTPGLIPGIRRAFGRLYDFLRRLRGILEGMGIVDASQALGAEEVFRRAASGQVGMRRHGPPSYRVREPSFVGDTGGPAYSLQPGDETVRLPSETRNLLGIDRNPVAHCGSGSAGREFRS
jgi:hypothetical protein